MDDVSNHSDMAPNTLTWQLVDETGAELGAAQSARLKWRQRGVPSKWRIDIVQALMSRGVAVSLAEFDRLEIKPGRIAA